MHAIESELIKATKYKVQRKFVNRQDYLKSIFNAAQKLHDDEFDDLSDEAAEWLNECVQVFNSKRDADLPDFDEVEPSDENIPSEEDEGAEGTSETGNGSEEDPEEGKEDPVSERGDEAEDSGSEESYEEEEPQLELLEEGEDQPESLEEEEAQLELLDKEPAPRPKTKKARKPKEKADPRIPKKPAKPLWNIPKDPGPAHFEEDAVLDKWGCIVGSKNSMALALFEKGATVREVKDKIGGTYYNTLYKMQHRGHRVEKEGSLVRLIHRDQIKDFKVSSRKNKK
jgi:hypothetical protein